jgi:predicted RNA-binding protein Jag
LLVGPDLWPKAKRIAKCDQPRPLLKSETREYHEKTAHVVKRKFCEVQAERAEKKAARQADKADRGRATRTRCLLQLPAGLTPSQRARIHAVADARGLLHESSGEEPNRVLRVGHAACELV